MNLNPFDLPGPAFLLFYMVLAAIVLGAVWLQVRTAEDAPPPALPLTEPYRIAWLRGGTPEAARIAVLSLFDRGLIEFDGDRLRLGPGRTDATRLSAYPPLERAVLDAAARNAPATALFTDPGVVRAAEELRRRLQSIGLVPDARARQLRLQWYGSGAALLIGTGFIKIIVALERGRSNVGFLLVLMVIASYVLILLLRRRRTGLGDRILADLRTLFAALKARAATLRAAAGDSDAVLLAAVFGLRALPGTQFAAVQQIYRKSMDTAGWAGGGGCGSGCGSGCGGGGGGCGGCGSS